MKCLVKSIKQCLRYPALKLDKLSQFLTSKFIRFQIFTELSAKLFTNTVCVFQQVFVNCLAYICFETVVVLMLLSTYLNIRVIYWGARLFKLLKSITAVLKLILLCRSIHPNLTSRMPLLFSGSPMALPLTSRMVRAICFCASTQLWIWGELVTVTPNCRTVVYVWEYVGI